jgi:hypothetical protein
MAKTCISHWAERNGFVRTNCITHVSYPFIFVVASHTYLVSHLRSSSKGFSRYNCPKKVSAVVGTRTTVFRVIGRPPNHYTIGAICLNGPASWIWSGQAVHERRAISVAKISVLHDFGKLYGKTYYIKGTSRVEELSTDTSTVPLGPSFFELWASQTDNSVFCGGNF